MRKGHYLSGLLIAVFAMIILPFAEAGPPGLVASAAPGLHGSANNMLQFKAGGHLLGFQPGKVCFASLDHALSVEFLGTPGVMPGAISKTAAEGGETGKESKVPTLGTVVYEDLWEGISLTYEAREEGIAESTYHIGPRADVSKIRLRYNVPVEVQSDGSLKFKFDRGFLTESSPEAWQEIAGERVPVAVAFEVKGGEVGFSVGKYDPDYPLTIDPTYAWHTFYGSTLSDGGDTIATDGSGNVYLTGTSGAWNGPAGQSPLHAYTGGMDTFVLKLNRSGAYQWHTFYGPTTAYRLSGPGVSTDGNGNVYVKGLSDVTWNGPDGQSPLHPHSGGTGIFVLKLDNNGAYQWHTFYGSTIGDGGGGDASTTDGSGNVYVTGESDATWDGPDGQSPLHPHSGSYDIFVLKLDSTGAYQWHTFYGSSDWDDGYGIAADGSGNVYVTGWSAATWIGPTGQSPLHAHSGIEDFFVLKLNSSGAYQWHTFYGSSSWGNAIATDGSGNVYVTGTSSATWNGPDGQSPLHAYSGSFDILVLKLDSSGAYRWHIFYGASANEQGWGIAADGSGNVYVTGWSLDTWNGPAGKSPLHTYSGSYDIFVLKLFDAPASCDFDGDGRTDISFYRSSTGVWWVTPSSGVPAYGYGWGGPGFKPVPGDYDGDTKTDIAIYDTTGGAWWIIPSSGIPSYGVGWGRSGFKPVLGDYDGDTKTDIAIYDTAGGAWWIIPSSGTGPQGQLGAYGVGWGGSGFKPVLGDYDGDGKTDIAIYDATGGAWWVIPSSGIPAYGIGWGGSAFTPVPGDYDGDNKTDIAIYHASAGAWWIIPSSGTGPQGQVGAYGVGWGGSGFTPVPGDYDGDGKTDVAIYQSSNGGWWIIYSSDGSTYGMGWGGDASDVPLTTNPDN